MLEDAAKKIENFSELNPDWYEKSLLARKRSNKRSGKKRIG